MKPLLWTAIALLVLTLSGCKRETSWHQRLTIVVETPTGRIRGSSVTQDLNTETSGSLVLPEARGVRNAVTGEAVVMEVAPGRYLFALLGGSDDQYRDASHWVYPAYNLGDAGSYSAAMSIVQAQPYDTPVPLPPEGWPLMVTFTDIADPTSVARVDRNALAPSFGAGVRLKSVTVKFTQAGVPEGAVERVLKLWLGMRSAENGAIPALRLPNNIPRGWNHLDPLQFWSLEKVFQMNEGTESLCRRTI